MTGHAATCAAAIEGSGPVLTKTTPLRSRRALLTAAFGAGIGTVASALGRPLPARAADGEAVVVGGEYIASSVTKFETVVTREAALWGVSDSGSGVRGYSTSGYGVEGWSSAVAGVGVSGGSDKGRGVDAYSDAGTGLQATSLSGTAIRAESLGPRAIDAECDDGIAVRGHSGGGIGVLGESGSSPGVQGYSPESCGVFGWNQSVERAAVLGGAHGNCTGVQGYSGGGAPQIPLKTGVYGYAAQDTNARGVYGQTTVGRGVFGQATTGHGVLGYATTGVAGYFGTANAMSGYALRAIGRVKLDKCAGVATISSGKSSVLVTPGIDIGSGSAVVATLQGSAGGTTTVHRVAIDTTANTFTIYLTANSTTNVKVAWHVFG
jgi:hypothetical protein